MAEPSLNFVQHGLRPTSKLIILALASIALLMLDHRYDAIQHTRSLVTTILYPVQWLAKQPVNFVQNAWGYVQNQHQLQHDNQALIKQNAQWRLRWQQQQTQIQALTHLNAIKQLQDTALPQGKIAEIISAGLNPIADRFIINQGSRNHIRAGDPVTDEQGLLGQVSAVQPFSAEVTLLTNEQSVIPAMVARTGVRTLIYGRPGSVDLRYFPTDADLRVRDLLVTSGMDSIYPAGIPIATVTGVQSSNASPYYRVQLQASAHIRSSRFVLVIPQKKMAAAPDAMADAP